MRITTIERVFNLLSRDYPNPKTHWTKPAGFGAEKHSTRKAFRVSTELPSVDTHFS